MITAIKDTISFKLINLINDAQGRYIILVASIDNVIYTIVNIYAPNKNPHQFIQKILKKTRKSYILWRLQCTYGPRYGHLQGRNYLQEGIISHFFLRRHVWCLEMPAHNGKGLHFFSHVHKSYSRIDYFIADKLLLPKITKACIHNITWSDHAPITLEINQGLPCSNSYIWRNNTFILSQETHLSVLRKNLEEFFVIIDKEPINCITLWCTHKAYARGLLIQAATREKKRKPIW